MKLDGCVNAILHVLIWIVNSNLLTRNLTSGLLLSTHPLNHQLFIGLINLQRSPQLHFCFRGDTTSVAVHLHLSINKRWLGDCKYHDDTHTHTIIIVFSLVFLQKNIWFVTIRNPSQSFLGLQVEQKSDWSESKFDSLCLF